MSTGFAAQRCILCKELFDGRLEEYGIRPRLRSRGEAKIYLTDGRNSLLVFCNDDESVALFKCYLSNGNPNKILSGIEKAFKTKIYSEYEPQYWGFETQEEWDKAEEELVKRYKKQFQKEALKLLRGKAHSIKRGTIGMVKAQIAKSLVYADPSLLSAKNHTKLFKAVDETYFRDHVQVFALTDEDIATAKFVTTHEDDLPKA